MIIFITIQKLLYYQHYFDVVDYVAGNILRQFNQPDYLIFVEQQTILLKATIACKVYWEFTMFHRKSWFEVKV